MFKALEFLKRQAKARKFIEDNLKVDTGNMPLIV